MKRLSGNINAVVVVLVFFMLFAACLAEDATILHKQLKTDGVMGQKGQESTSVTYLSSGADRKSVV